MRIPLTLCLSLSVSVNAQDETGRTALHYVGPLNSPDEFVSLLMNWPGVDLNLADDAGDTPVMVMARNGRVSQCSVIAKDSEVLTKVSWNVQNKEGWTVLHVAIAANHLDILNLLLKSVLELLRVNVQTFQKKHTPALMACSLGFCDHLRSLLETKLVDLEAVELGGGSLCHIAVRTPLPSEEHRLSLCRLLLDWNCPTDIRDNQGILPVVDAIRLRRLTVCKDLIAHGCSLELSDSRKCFPLHIAVEEHADFVLALLDSKHVEVNIRGPNGMTPLHFCSANRCSSGFEEIAWILISRGHCDINAQDNDGSTPLHQAVQSDNLTMAKMLIHSNCDLSLKDRGCFTPFDVAVRERMKDMTDLLGAKVKCTEAKCRKVHIYSRGLKQVKCISCGALLTVESSPVDYVPPSLDVAAKP